MDALPPDPYAALGVAKDATTAHIKQQYRKLVLKLHPDKVQEDHLKQAAADQFHKVQSAYEIVSDEDRRQRYDAQCKLEELRRDAMQRGGGGRGPPDVRMAGGYRMPPESARGGDFYTPRPERSGRMSPNFEERAPRYEYFEPPPRSTARKDNDFERPSKRAPAREDPKKSKTSSSKKTKENERSARDERSRRSDQDQRKERERKNAYAFQQSPTSDSDEQDRARNAAREEENYRRARAAEEEMRRARAAAAETEMRREATASVFGEERARKYFDQESQARAYQNGTSPVERSPPTQRRPSPARKSSSRENVEYIKRKDGQPPVMIRRGSGRPESSREPRKSSSREKSFEIVDEPEEISPTSRRPPTLNKTNSSPADIRPPFERQRSSSMQYDPRDAPIPSMKRAETMPYPTSSSRKDPSKLRTQVAQDAYATPESSPEPTPRRSSAGRGLTDNNDDYYRTEFREPPSPRERGFTPMEDYPDRRERSRPTSSKHAPPQPKRTTSTTYVYSTSPTEMDDYTAARRPSLQRESSKQLYEKPLFGEVTNDREAQIRSPAPTSKSRHAKPAVESISRSREIRAEDIKMSAGYGRSRPMERSYSSRQGTPVR